MSIFLDLPIYFDAEGGGAGNTGDPAPQDNTEDKGNPGKPDPAQNSGEKTLPQSEVDKLVGAARKEGRESALANALKDLGFADLDSLKKYAKAGKDAEEAGKTELERLQESETGAKSEAASWKAKAEETEAALRAERITNSFELALSEAGARNRDHVLILMEKTGAFKAEDLFTQEGKVNREAVKAAVEAFKKGNEDYFKPVDPNPGSFGHGGKGTPPAPDQAQMDKAKEAMRRMVRL